MTGFFKKTIHVSFIILAFFSIINTAFSQESNNTDSLATLDLSLNPTNPRGGDSVVLTLSSNLLDLDSSRIVWFVNGVARKSTSNKSITIKLDSSGLKTTIKAVVETTDGIIKEVSREFTPSGVDLIIEPVAYTTPFYKGKPYLLGQGTIKVVAVPDVMIDGAKIANKDLNFVWKKSDNIISSSGKGKNFILLDSTIPVKDINLSLEVFDSAGNRLAENSKTIIISKPQILFYENSPLYGILYNKAVTGNYFLGTREELKIVAKPFSFSFMKDTPTESDYSWYVNDNYVAPSEKINEILLKQTSNTLKGTAYISLTIKNKNRMNQFINNAFNVIFGE